MDKKKTYISLFSSAGVGCYGFKLAGFECIATNEFIQRRLDVQKFNKKCKYESGYICGDITLDSTKELLFNEIELWKRQESVNRVDVIVATPPCQGMSVANHKKSDKEIIRNSLVVESIKIINKVNPKFFVFENVPAFLKTICTDVDGKDKNIAEAIENNLGKKYSFIGKIINFKNHGACSSRQRCLVIGVSNDYSDEISPYELFPKYVTEKTLKEVIGGLPRLNTFGEISKDDIYHAFREYPSHMRNWIHDLKEGESAFEQQDIEKKPHQIIDGLIVINTQKNGDKYRRQFWNKVGPCIHTRNDQLASQNTIHPEDDRVFSIRELMNMMTVPDTFNWVNKNIKELNSLDDTEKRAFLKKEEIKIRQSLGEAVPTVIFRSIATKLSEYLNSNKVNANEISRIIRDSNLEIVENMVDFIRHNPLKFSVATLSKIAEMANVKRIENAAYYTDKCLVTEIVKHLPDIPGDTVSILEPSVGMGNFLPLLFKKYENKNIQLDVVDIDENCFKVIKALLKYYDVPKKFKINYIGSDFLQYRFKKKYDLVIGNPPFIKLKGNAKELATYRGNAINKVTANLSDFFLEKAISLGKYVSLVMPKNILNTPEYNDLRMHLKQYKIDAILDFGEMGFHGVKIETINIGIDTEKKPSYVEVVSLPRRVVMIQKQKYITDEILPYWIIYRDSFFDDVTEKVFLGQFEVFRDRQLTKSMLKCTGDFRVIKARNIDIDGSKIIDIPGYDAYVDNEIAKSKAVFSYLQRDDVYLTPNMTYYPRVIKKEKNTLVDGSVAILKLKSQGYLNKKQMLYFSSDEFRRFYCIARNYQTRSLNIDACSVYFFGVLKDA